MVSERSLSFFEILLAPQKEHVSQRMANMSTNRASQLAIAHVRIFDTVMKQIINALGRYAESDSKIVDRDKIEANLRLHVGRLAGLIGARSLKQPQTIDGRAWVKLQIEHCDLEIVFTVSCVSVIE